MYVIFYLYVAKTSNTIIPFGAKQPGYPNYFTTFPNPAFSQMYTMIQLALQEKPQAWLFYVLNTAYTGNKHKIPVAVFY